MLLALEKRIMPTQWTCASRKNGTGRGCHALYSCQISPYLYITWQWYTYRTDIFNPCNSTTVYFIDLNSRTLRYISGNVLNSVHSVSTLQRFHKTTHGLWTTDVRHDRLMGGVDHFHMIDYILQFSESFEYRFAEHRHREGCTDSGRYWCSWRNSAVLSLWCSNTGMILKKFVFQIFLTVINCCIPLLGCRKMFWRWNRIFHFM